MYATLSTTYSGLSLKMLLRVTQFQIHNVAEHHFQSHGLQSQLSKGFYSWESEAVTVTPEKAQDSTWWLQDLKSTAKESTGQVSKNQSFVSSLFHVIVTWVLAVVMESHTMAFGGNSPRSLRFTTQAVTVFTADTHRSFLKRPVFLANGRLA